MTALMNPFLKPCKMAIINIVPVSMSNHIVLGA